MNIFYSTILRNLVVYCELKNKNARKNARNVFATRVTHNEPMFHFKTP